MEHYSILPYSHYRDEEIKPLYESVGWTSYLRYPELLPKAYAHSLKIFAAYDSERLVGIIRSIGDMAYRSCIFKICWFIQSISTKALAND